MLLRAGVTAAEAAVGTTRAKQNLPWHCSSPEPTQQPGATPVISPALWEQGPGIHHPLLWYQPLMVSSPLEVPLVQRTDL